MEFAQEGDACVGLFTVRKRSGAQRLVADCRQSNCFFLELRSCGVADVGGSVENAARGRRAAVCWAV
eukprot:9494469-Pyramimonas_sp.AAC.1